MASSPAASTVTGEPANGRAARIQGRRGRSLRVRREEPFRRGSRAAERLRVPQRLHQLSGSGFIALQFLVTNAERFRQRASNWICWLNSDSLTSELNATVRRRSSTGSRGFVLSGAAPDNLATGSCNLSGAALANAPELKTHAALQYELPSSFVLRPGDWTWSGRVLHQLESRSAAGPGSLSSGRCSRRRALRRHGIVMWGKNLPTRRTSPSPACRTSSRRTLRTRHSWDRAARTALDSSIACSRQHQRILGVLMTRLLLCGGLLALSVMAATAQNRPAHREPQAKNRKA